jgi:UDP-N-acetylenolpyruvoylglucosamine reductase
MKQGKDWTNYGQNLTAHPVRYEEPSTAEEVQSLVKEAKEAGQKIRVVGDSHSWSPLVPTNEMMISTANLNRIISVEQDPPSITVEPGVTVAQTLNAYSEHGVTLPMNVDVPPITIGGAVSVGANGFSRHWGTYSEFVSAIEFVDGQGAIRTLTRKDNPSIWRAAACSLGLWGIITKITLELVPMFNVHVSTTNVPKEQALEQMGEIFNSHDYAQFFWFPFTDDIQVQVSDVTDEPSNWTPKDDLRKDLNGWLEAGASHLISSVLLKFPAATPMFTNLAFKHLHEGDFVMLQSDNVMLGKWIDYMYPNENISVSFPCDEGCEAGREAWMMASDLVDEFAAVNKFPVNLEMNARIFGKTTTLLGSLPGDGNEATFNIQITSFKNPAWADFSQKLMEKWLTIPGSRPHWAKQYQDVPNIASIISARFGENLTEFLQLRDAQNVDPDHVFVNDFLDRLLFNPSSEAQS